MLFRRSAALSFVRPGGQPKLGRRVASPSPLLPATVAARPRHRSPPPGLPGHLELAYDLPVSCSSIPPTTPLLRRRIAVPVLRPPWPALAPAPAHPAPLPRPVRAAPTSPAPTYVRPRSLLLGCYFAATLLMLGCCIAVALLLAAAPAAAHAAAPCLMLLLLLKLLPLLVLQLLLPPVARCLVAAVAGARFLLLVCLPWPGLGLVCFCVCVHNHGWFVPSADP